MRIFLVVVCWLLALPAAAESMASLPAPVAEALAAAGIPATSVGVVVESVEDASPRLSINADQAMNPASVMKLLTTFAALEILGPAYTWKTDILSPAPIVDGTLQGDLYLRGSGDPSLTFEQFWLLLRQLRARGVQTIAGDLVLDRSLFALPDHDPAAFDNKPMRPYNVGPDALLLNFKSMRILLSPDAAAGKLRVAPEPSPANVELINSVRLTQRGCGNWKEKLNADVSREGQRWRLRLSGEYAAACGEHVWNLAVLPHSAYVGGVFEQLWYELGGTWQGKLRDGVAPADAPVLAAIESPTLAEIVRNTNKYSNNVMARQMFLTIGGQDGHRPVTPADAETALYAWLKRRGLNFPELILENGAGLSRVDRISAAHLAQLLRTAWRSPVMPELIASLPVVAVDGTLKKRAVGDGMAGRAHLKTGTLDGVKTIAGYVLDHNDRMQIVVFLVNQANADAAQAAQDALLDWVYYGSP